jgi:hypothetical protein
MHNCSKLLHELSGSLQESAPSAGISRRAFKWDQNYQKDPRGFAEVVPNWIFHPMKFRASRRSRAEDSRKIGTSVVLLLLFFFWH